MKPLFKYYGPAILWALFILIMCSIKLGSISNSPLFSPGFDKLVHCGFFFMMVTLICIGAVKHQLPSSLPFKYLLVITICVILYGGIIELLQLLLFTWRSGEWDDLFADSIGALMGAFSVLTITNAMNYVKK